MPRLLFVLQILGIVISTCPGFASAQVLDKQKLLSEQTWWDNRDFDWYQSQIPFFECPDSEIQTTYYYRWDLLTKHLTYGSPNTGYVFTEFIDRPFWSGAYGAISCPAGHQLYEARWLRSPRVANDYTKYWFRNKGAQPRNYSTWLADSAWAVHQVHPDSRLLEDLLPDLVSNYEGWERSHFVPEVGLFWQTGHDDGMEININSRQTQDTVRGAPSYRPSFNSYMIADAIAIGRIANLVGDTELAKEYKAKATSLKAKMLELMWDPERQFFFPVLKNDEERDGHRLQALTRTYESGEYDGDTHGRELIGYVPWQFNLLQDDRRFDVAWKKLMDRDGFYAEFGPSFVERNDPQFVISKTCCWWSGQSWPYATTQTLKGLANLLRDGGETLNAEDLVELLRIYAKSHRKNGKPYLAEALNPDTGSFEGYDAYNHSQHYLHSGYIDLVINDLVGLVPRDDATLELFPLAPADWDYFALEDVPYRGHLISILWDRSGTRYDFGAGLHFLVNGERVFTSADLKPVEIPNALKATPTTSDRDPLVETNFAVNNDASYFPRITSSFTAERTSPAKLIDGNYWYLQHPPNRWTAEGSPNAIDSIEVDFGASRTVHTIRLYVLDDRNLVLDDRPVQESNVRAPAKIELQFENDGEWQSVPIVSETTSDRGHSPHTFRFEPIEMRKFKVLLTHADGFRSGLTEVEAWGDAKLPIGRLPARPGNLAFNDGVSEFPKASCSHHDIYGGVPQSAIDGVTNFQASPMNRWTSYGSPNATDWLEIDFGQSIEFRRVELAIYDDRGGVQAPDSFEIQVLDGEEWKVINDAEFSPETAVGGQWNTVRFTAVTGRKLKVVFQNRGAARSGVSEVTVWNDAVD